MSVIVLSGFATNIALGSDYTYAATANHGPVAIKNQLVSMRIEGKPVLFRTRTLPSISDGDQVAAGGLLKNGTLEALAVRNLTTGAVYCPPTIMPMVLAVVLIILGLPLILFLGFGLLFVGVGVWVLLRVIRVRKAAGLLSGPSPAPAMA